MFSTDLGMGFHTPYMRRCNFVRIAKFLYQHSFTQLRFSATIGILYLAFYVGDNIVVGIAAVALLPPVIAISHAWCMEWHLRSLEEQPDAMRYWLEASY